MAARTKQRGFIAKGLDQLYLLAWLDQHCAQSELLALPQVVLGIRKNATLISCSLQLDQDPLGVIEGVGSAVEPPDVSEGCSPFVLTFDDLFLEGRFFVVDLGGVGVS